MPVLSNKRENLIRRAQTVLRPSLAILLECAFESEHIDKAASFLEELTKRFYTCAEKGTLLRDGDYEVFDIFLPSSPGAVDTIAVGLISEKTRSSEAVFQTGISPGHDGFIKYAAKCVLELPLAEFAPAVIGVGIAQTADEARLLARMAMFRSPDRHSHDEIIMECERRILAAVNHGGPGAGGFGGGHTALAVSIEQTGAGYLALCPGDYFTRFASEKF